MFEPIPRLTGLQHLLLVQFYMAHSKLPVRVDALEKFRLLVQLLDDRSFKEVAALDGDNLFIYDGLCMIHL
jgi:hypothetical protein